MSKFSPRIYKVNEVKFAGFTPENFIDSFIDKYNAEHNTNQFKKIECLPQDGVFQLKQYLNYPIHKPPSWLNIAKSAALAGVSFSDVGNKNHSYLLFVYSSDEIYIITGGYSHNVIEEIVDYDFGFNVVERLIDPNKTEIRSLSQRGFIGIELASNRFFKSDFVFFDNDDFGKFYRGLEAFIDEKALAKLGVITDKQKLLVRGETGFKVDTAVDLMTILERIQRLSKLLKNPIPIGFEINPFRNVRPRELNSVFGKYTLEENLDRELFLLFFNRMKLRDDTTEIFHPVLMPFLRSDSVYIQKGTQKHNIPTNTKIYPKTILRKFGVDTSALKFEEFVNLVKSIRTLIYDAEYNERIHERRLSEWLSGEITFQNKKYIKFENVWYTFSRNFLADIIDINAKQMIVYHVKKGLDRNFRVLQSQILNSAKLLSEFRASNFDHPELQQYFKALNRNTTKKVGVSIDFDTFKNEYIKRDELHYVFAFATKSKASSKDEILQEIKSSPSTIAKISLLHTYYSLKEKEIKMSVAKIIKR